MLALFDKFVVDDDGLEKYVREYNSLLESIRGVDGSDEQWLTEKFKFNFKEENGKDSSLAVGSSVTDDGGDDKKTTGAASVKKVRFDDTVACRDTTDNSDGNNNNNNTTTFKPYSDREDTATSKQPSLLDTVSNQQLFIDQQRQLMDQDTALSHWLIRYIEFMVCHLI